MENTKELPDRSMWAMGGGVMLGLGAGFFYLQTSVLAFVGCMIAGIGLGLIVTAVLSRIGKG